MATRVGTPSTPSTPSIPDAAAPTAEEALDADRRRAATELGLPFESLDPAEYELLDAHLSGELDSLKPGNDPDNPLIPAEEATTEPTSAADGATTDDAEAGVRTGTEASSGGEEAGGPHGTPAATTSEPPSPPPVPADEPTYINVDGQPVRSELVTYGLDLASTITPEEIEVLNRLRAGAAAVTFVDPTTGQPVQPVSGAPTPSSAPPSPASTAPVLPPQDEWVDPAAYAAYQAIQAQMAPIEQSMQALTTQQQQIFAAQVADQQRMLDAAADAASAAFQQATGLDDNEMLRLAQVTTQAGILPVFAARFPGDPTTAVTEALSAMYWSTPEFREREVSAAISRHREITEDTDRRKALAGAVVSPAGSTPRTAPPPSTPQDRQRAMVADIEAAMHANANGS